jgi:pimeloyl-ACP methyl ester carboxylesterase
MDRRRHGSSDWGSEPATLEREAEDVLDMCRAHGPMKALIGHSAGGLIALHAALEDKEGLFQNLVLYDPAVSFGPILGDKFDEFRNAIEDGEYERAMAGILPFAGVTAVEQELIKQPEFWPGIVAHAPQELDFLASVCRLEPGLERYREIRTRTLVFRGENTLPALRERVQALTEVMPGASPFVLEGQGHMANAFVPRLLADEISKFIDEE